jgi:hypothetical protein
MTESSGDRIEPWREHLGSFQDPRMGSIEILDAELRPDLSDSVGDERVAKGMQGIIRLPFRVRVVMISLPSHHFLLLHLDAGELVDQPFDLSLALPRQNELRIHRTARVPPLDNLDGGFNPEGAIGVHERLRDPLPKLISLFHLKRDLGPPHILTADYSSSELLLQLRDLHDTISDVGHGLLDVEQWNQTSDDLNLLHRIALTEFV